MSQALRRRIATGVLVAVSWSVLIVALEIVVRRTIVSRSFGHIQVDSASFPFFRLVEEYTNDRITIRHGLREHLSRGGRDRRVAFVGDSVTFGSGVQGDLSYVELIQRHQEVFDALNHGVPGYGLPEVEARVAEILEEDDVDAVIYTYNFNDIHTGMPGLLPLSTTRDTRLVALQELDGRYGRAILFIRDHFKLPFVVRRVFTDLAGPRDARRPSAHRTYTEISLAAQDSQFQGVYSAWKQLYADPSVAATLRERLASIRDRVVRSGAAFGVVIHYDFLILDGEDRLPRAAILAALDGAEIAYADPYELLRRHYREPGFFVDPGHPGEVGSRFLADVSRSFVARVLENR